MGPPCEHSNWDSWDFSGSWDFWDSWARAAARARRRAQTRRSRSSCWASPGSTRAEIRRRAECRAISSTLTDRELGSVVRRSAPAAGDEVAPVAAADSSETLDGSIVRDCWSPSPTRCLSDEFTFLPDRVISDGSTFWAGYLSRFCHCIASRKRFAVGVSKLRP